jgi:UDP-N-acetylglucosamine--N-acetylmuramyl-(pentapeptide) pyrophosphoryl-undecaprenol N-acetylglucosamine transferase
MPNVILAGGGTGGHIEPALNLADELRRRNPDISITALGTSKGLETTMVPGRGYDLELIPPVPLARKPTLEWFSLPVRVRRAVLAAQEVLVSKDAHVVVGFGGYVSLPAYLAARRAKVPIVIHEANAKAGLANRIGARMTEHVAENYAGSLSNAVRIGCPLRRVVAELDRSGLRATARQHFGLDLDRPTLLAFGGSQGAQQINGAIRGAIVELGNSGVQILHAVGPGNTTNLETGYEHYHPVPFIERMDLAYASADITVCRSGAMTCAELAAVGLPAVYVPYPSGNGEQRLNADPVVSAGGGRLIADGELDATTLLATVLPLLADPDELADMGSRALAYGIPDAAARLADMTLKAAGSRA